MKTAAPTGIGDGGKENTTSDRSAEYSPDLLHAQATRIARRFGLTAATAATVAALVYREAAQ